MTRQRQGGAMTPRLRRDDYWRTTQQGVVVYASARILSARGADSELNAIVDIMDGDYKAIGIDAVIQFEHDAQDIEQVRLAMSTKSHGGTQRTSVDFVLSMRQLRLADLRIARYECEQAVQELTRAAVWPGDAP